MDGATAYRTGLGGNLTGGGGGERDWGLGVGRDLKKPKKREGAEERTDCRAFADFLGRLPDCLQQSNLQKSKLSLCKV